MSEKIVRITKATAALLIVCLFFGLLFKLDEGRINGAADGADNYLIGAGMSEEIVSSLSEEHKAYIFEKIGNKKTHFLKSTDVAFSSSGKKPAKGKTGDIELSFISFKDENIYYIFPSFEWHKDVSVAGNTFKTEMLLGWHSDEMTEDMVLYTKNVSGGIIGKTDLKQSGILECGSIFIMTSENKTKYSGYGFLTATKLSSTSGNTLSYNYTCGGVSFTGIAKIE